MPATRSAFEFERGRIVRATLELCAERGYGEISAADVARRAGVAVAVLDSLFPKGKEECVVAAESALLSDVLTAVSSGYSADRSEWDNVVHGILALLELLAANPPAAFLGFVVARQMSPPGVYEIYASGHRMLTAMLERGWTYSTSDVQPSRAAAGALGGAMALVRAEIFSGRADQLPRLLPALAYSATVPFLGQEDAMGLVRRSRAVLRETPWGEGAA